MRKITRSKDEDTMVNDTKPGMHEFSFCQSSKNFFHLIKFPVANFARIFTNLLVSGLLDVNELA